MSDRWSWQVHWNMLVDEKMHGVFCLNISSPQHTFELLLPFFFMHLIDHPTVPSVRRTYGVIHLAHISGGYASLSGVPIIRLRSLIRRRRVQRTEEEHAAHYCILHSFCLDDAIQGRRNRAETHLTEAEEQRAEWYLRTEDSLRYDDDEKARDIHHCRYVSRSRADA